MRPTVLIIDDSQNMQTFLNQMFATDYNIVSFSRSEDALSYLETNSDVDAVIADTDMPGYDGLELMKDVKNQLPHLASLPFIALGDPQSQKRLKALEAGAITFLEKPFNPIELKIYLQRVTVESLQLAAA